MVTQFTFDMKATPLHSFSQNPIHKGTSSSLPGATLISMHAAPLPTGDLLVQGGPSMPSLLHGHGHLIHTGHPQSLHEWATHARRLVHFVSASLPASRLALADTPARTRHPSLTAPVALLRVGVYP